MQSNHLILCHPLLLLPSIFPSMSLFQWVSSSHQVAKVLELQLRSFQWMFRVDFLYDWLVWSPCSPGDCQESSPAPLFKSINSLVLHLLLQRQSPQLLQSLDVNSESGLQNICISTGVPPSQPLTLLRPLTIMSLLPSTGHCMGHVRPRAASLQPLLWPGLLLTSSRGNTFPPSGDWGGDFHSGVSGLWR